MSEQKPLKAHELNPPLKVTRISSLEELEPLLDFFKRCGGILGWDIETDPKKDYFYRRCRTIQFGNAEEQYVIDLLPFCDGNPDMLFEAQGHYGKHLDKTPNLKELLSIIQPVVCTKDFLKVGVNLSFEYMSFYWLFGLRTFHFFDCAMVEKCIWAGAHSMKDYGFYSMEGMMQRYFKVQIDKELQESFTLDGTLTDEQVQYAALDTRFPIALRTAQMLVLQGWTAKQLAAKGAKAANIIKNIDPIVTGDNLLEIAGIENDAIGAFQDMHIHGERVDRERWLKRVAGKKEEMKKLISDVLDPIFLPIVGSKLDTVTDAEIEQAKGAWKKFNIVGEDEVKLKGEIRLAKKSAPETVPAMESQLAELEAARKEKKEKLKTVASELGKKRTKIKNLAAKCEGEALINYGSDAQLLAVINGMKGLKNVRNLEDEMLEKYEHIAVMSAIRKYHGLAKEIGTYGDQWAMEWVTKPCKEEGWLHPGDGRLHCVFNQYDAETGRSSSEKPNGQNLPQDKEIRSCFIADASDESIRISTCCDAATRPTIHPNNVDQWAVECTQCGKVCEYHETKAEEYVIVTADMSGAELRIIAELADDPVWIGAFARGEDVHSVGTEILYPEEWPKLALPDCAYFKLREDGTPQRKKCKCPEHNALRNATKAINFLLAYGGGPHKLAQSIGKPVEEARRLMEIHSQKFPRIWAYLEDSGKKAKILKKAFDMFGRRRLFPEPNWDRAKEKAKEDREKQLRYGDEEAEKNIQNFTIVHKRKPTKDELWLLEHRLPTQREINNAFMSMHGTIERQGKNHCIQGTNATIAKLAMSCAFDPDGKPYLWHILPKYGARLIKFVHDELVIQSPKRHANAVAAEVQDAFERAAKEKMSKVVMESEFNIAATWQK